MSTPGCGQKGRARDFLSNARILGSSLLSIISKKFQRDTSCGVGVPFNGGDVLHKWEMMLIGAPSSTSSIAWEQ